MILPRTLYNEAPPAKRSRNANNPTLLYSWWATIFSVIIIGTRLVGRYMRNERLFREDKIMALSVIPLMARMGLIHVVLIYGTNNAQMDGMEDSLMIHHREIGSKVVLAARICYTLFIWTAKFTVSEFLKRMTERFWKKGYESGLRGIRLFLGITFIAVIIATLSECRPFSHNYQVVPDPGPQCRQGYAHLLTMGITDIVTDILLVFFPIPIIVRSAMSLRKKVSLISLFSMSIVLIIITGIRIPLVIKKSGLQQYRTVFASSEILAATIVANAIILGSFLRDRGIKKAKYKAGSTSDSTERRSSTRRNTLQRYGSDENLARELGYRPNPDLIEEKSDIAIPAKVADLSVLTHHGHSQPPFSNTNWHFPEKTSAIHRNSEDSFGRDRGRVNEDPLPSPRSGRRVSFYDVGGLLENALPSSDPSPTDSVIAQDFAPQPRRTSIPSSSHASNGRSFPPPARRSSRLSQSSAELETVWPNQQVDLRGFLSEGPEPAGRAAAVNTHTAPPASASHATHPSTRRSILRGSIGNSHSREPSLQDAGGLLSSP